MATITLGRDRPFLSPEDKATVLEVMRAMLASGHFSKSKRYPALLEYCVQNTLKGDLSALKERVIGSDVFGRPANYDASEDPIVRITAGEVRKRIALYFDEHRDAAVRIDLPLGSYVCTFHFRDQESSSHGEMEGEALSAPSLPAIADEPSPFSAEPGAASSLPAARAQRPALLWIGAVLCCAMALGAWQYVRVHRHDVWQPVFHENVPAVIVVGQGKNSMPASGDATAATLSADVLRPRNQVEMANAIAAAHICGVFEQFHRPCAIVPARTATPDDLNHKSVVLVGGFDNPWTERLLTPLRFHLSHEVASGETPGRFLSIVDQEGKATGSPWRVDREIAPDQMQNDYLIIARFHNDSLDDDVVVAAGIWTHGTEAAGEFVSSPEKMARILSQAPAGWKGFNFEAVLQTDVINGAAGNVKVLATNFW